MRKRLAALIAALMLLALAFAVPAHADGQHPYTLIDPGTFGGPQSFLNLPAVPLTGPGGLLGTADTTIHDARYPNFNPFMVGFADPYLVEGRQDDRPWHLGRSLRVRDLDQRARRGRGRRPDGQPSAAASRRPSAS